MTLPETLVTHSAMPKPLAVEIRPDDHGLQLVVSLSRNILDALSNSLVTVDFEHHELHEGNHFFYTDSVELNSGGVQDYLLTVPNTTKRVHMVMIEDGTAITQFQVYEGTTRTGTTLQTLFNSDRASSKTPGLTIHKGTSAGADGTLLRQYKSGVALGASFRVPSDARDEHELILRPGTKYILRVTSSTNNNLTNVRFIWYEVITGEG